MPGLFEDLVPTRAIRTIQPAEGGLFDDLIPSRGDFGLGTADTIRAPRRTDVGPVASQVVKKVRGVTSGVLGSASAMASVPKLAETTLGIDTPVGRAADRLSKRIESKAKALAPKDPDFSDMVASGFGSSLTFFVPGIAVGRTVGAVAKVAPALATWLGIGTSTVMEAATEAGDTFNSLRDSGVSDQEAAKKSNGVFLKNLGLIAATNRLGVFAERGKALTRLSKGAGFEGAQEAGQEVFQEQAAGVPLDPRAITQSAGVGAVVGGGLGGATSLATRGQTLTESLTGSVKPILPGERQTQAGAVSLPGGEKGKTRIQRRIDQAITPPQEKVSVSERSALSSQIKTESALGKVRELKDRLQVERGGASFRERQLKQEIASRVPQAKALKESLRQQAKAASSAALSTTRELQSVKNQMAETIKKNLPLGLRGKFISAVASAKTGRDLTKAAFRVMNEVDNIQRSELISEIKGVVGKSLSSQQIDAGYKERIRSAMEPFRFGEITEATHHRLGATQEYISQMQSQGRDVEIPQRVLDRLKALSRRPLTSFSVMKLEVVRDDLELLARLGRTKLSSRQAIRDAQKTRIMGEVQSGTVPLESHLKIQPKAGEVSTLEQDLKNTFASALNTAQNLDVFTSPMAVLFDLLDGVRGYVGANSKNFKARLDTRFSAYLNEKDAAILPVQKRAQALGLSRRNFNRIGIHAARIQPGGMEYLLNRGMSDKEINSVVLTPQEMELYRLMRSEIEKPYDRVNAMIGRLENRTLGKIRNYFPVHTDFEAMSDLEIEKRVSESVSGFRTKQVEKGSTKKRVGGAQPIEINAMDVFTKHLDDVSYLLHMQEDIAILFEVANSPEYKEAAGDLGQKVVLDWLDVMARKGGVEGSRQIAWMDALRRNVGVAKLGFKLSSFVIQPTALFDGAARVGGRYVFPAFSEVVTDSSTRHWLKASFPELRNRVADDPSYGELSTIDALRKAQNKGLYMLKALDSVTASAVTLGAYKRALDRRGVAFDRTQLVPEAVQEAQLELQRTQASPLFKDLPLSLTRGSVTGNRSIDKALFQFKSFVMNRWSLIRHDMWRAGFMKGDIKQGVNVAFWLTMATLAETGIRRLSRDFLLSLFGGEKDEERAYNGDLLREFLSNNPFMSTIISGAVYGSDPLPSTEVLADLGQGGYRVLTGKKSSTKAKGAVRVAEGVASIAGIPGSSQAAQIARQMIGEEPTLKELKERFYRSRDPKERSRIRQQYEKTRQANRQTSRQRRQKERQIRRETPISNNRFEDLIPAGT